MSKNRNDLFIIIKLRTTYVINNNGIVKNVVIFVQKLSWMLLAVL